MHRFFFNVDGTIDYQYGANNRWNKADAAPEGVKSVVKQGRTYYMIEVAIPWKALGWEGAYVGQTMRVNIEVNDIRTKELRQEMFPDAKRNQSWTWPEFRLTPFRACRHHGTREADAVADSEAPVETLVTFRASVCSTPRPVSTYAVKAPKPQRNLSDKHNLSEITDELEISLSRRFNAARHRIHATGCGP